jgi:hypothetical protein
MAKNNHKTAELSSKYLNFKNIQDRKIKCSDGNKSNIRCSNSATSISDKLLQESVLIRVVIVIRRQIDDYMALKCVKIATTSIFKPKSFLLS